MRLTPLAALLAVPLAAPLLAAGAPTRIQPGQWEIVTTITSADMPGAPPQMTAMLKAHPNRVTQCVTAEDAAKGPQELMKSTKSCRFNRYSMTGGKLDAEMVCPQPGGTMTNVTTGSFTPTAFTTNAKIVATGARAMRISATTTGKRVGACAK